jgi:hypothetical protein
MKRPAQVSETRLAREGARQQLLFKMYDQMFNDINRHILVIWQSIGVIVGSFAIFSLVEKRTISIDVAVLMVSVLCGWMLAQLYDASYWYNRNLVIIANIERQFLNESDLRNIHSYFGEHRSNKMIFHLRIQRGLALWLLAIVVAFHFWTRVYPGLAEPYRNFDPPRAIPYLVLMLMIPWLNYVRNARAKAYAEFVKGSPGKEWPNARAVSDAGTGKKRALREVLKLAFQIRAGKKKRKNNRGEERNTRTRGVVRKS